MWGNQSWSAGSGTKKKRKTEAAQPRFLSVFRPVRVRCEIRVVRARARVIIRLEGQVWKLG